MSTEVATTTRMRWLELVKGIGLVLIIFNHALERMGELPHIANPSPDWAPIADRISQLRPTTGGAWDLAFNAIRYPGLLGEVGVQLFVIASGLGLTLSAMRRGGTDRSFLRRRLERIAPMWIVAHLLALAVSVPMLLFLRVSSDRVAAIWDPRFWASLVGLRIAPQTIYYLVASWWFIALLIQLYLVFPLLYRWFQRLGVSKYWYVVGGSIVIKLIGLLVLDSYLDPWSRGAIFITRLPEFAFGMMAAAWLTAADNPLRKPWVLAASIVAIPAGIVSSLTLAGNAWGPFVYGAGLFVVLYRLLADLKLQGRLADAWVWIGTHSLPLFMVHQPVYYFLMPSGFAGPVRVLGGFAIAAGLTLVGALILERFVAAAESTWQRWSDRAIVGKRVAVLIGGVLLVYGAFVAADALVRVNDPQEVLGWGERPSLVEDDVLGWKLAPDQTTRLQWQSYDYEVTANRFGFPGPAEEPAPADTRILTIGDAFTSAEGVDTAASWPRLVDEQSGQPTTVWNGAVTGYGPNQYAGVAEQLSPLFDPDVVVVGFFVNDFFDAEISNEEFQDSIGFGRPDPTGIVPTLRWSHLSQYLRYHVTESALAVLGKANDTGYFLGHFNAYEPGAIDESTSGFEAALAGLERVRAAAPKARMVMMLIPASVQVCEPEALDYYPDNVDLDGLDFDQPQRIANVIAAELGAEVLDLRPVFSASECLYQPKNMHWLEPGHATAAAELIDYLDLG